MTDFHAKLCNILGESRVKTKEPMSAHTTFRIGGPAAYYVTPCTQEELGETLRLCGQEKVPYDILGNGSNLLVGDQGYEGVMIAMAGAFSYCRIEGLVATAGSGTLLSKVAKELLRTSLTGFEFAAGIPGSVGGATVMNAGAYGSEMKAVLVSAKVMSPEGEVKHLTAEELELGYRTSCIQKNQYVVLEVSLELKPGEYDSILHRMEDLAERRRSKQPLEYPSAGSTFKRPCGYFAGKLIQDAGLRGYQVGGAQISEKHCGFVINKSNATAADVMKLCADVRDRVYDMAGVELDMEIKRLGIF